MTCPQQFAITVRIFSVAGRDHNRKWNGKAKAAIVSSWTKSPTTGREEFFWIQVQVLWPFYVLQLYC